MLVTTTDEWASVLDALAASRCGDEYVIGLDLETTGLRPFHGDRLIGAAVMALPGDAWDSIDPYSAATQTWYVPFRHKSGPNLPIRTLKWLAPILAEPRRRLYNHRLKFDAQFCYIDDMPVHNQHGDSMLAAHQANENELLLNLDFLCKKYIAPDFGKFEDELLAWAKAEWGGRVTTKMVKSRMAEVPPEFMWRYAEQDVLASWMLFWNRAQVIADDDGWDLLWETMDYSYIGLQMEQRGVLVQPELCRTGKKLCEERKAALYAQMAEMVGYDFNPGSAPQMQRIFNIPSTKKEILAELDPQTFPLIEPLLEWRQWDRMDTAYYDVYLEQLDEVSRVHTDLDLTGTISSRLSSKKPNLQALPRETDVYKVRDVVAAPPGFKLVSFDYSQIELRMVAYYTQDPSLLSAYQGGEDIHTQTANATGLDRDQAPGAKTLNFSSTYGIGVPGVSRKFHVTELEAQRLLDRFHGKYPGISKLRRNCERLARKNGYIEMWTGRRRHFGRGIPEHKAMSNLIQGGVAEIMRVAITRLFHELIEGSNAYIVLQVHDDILFEIPDAEVLTFIPRIKNIMEDFDFSINDDPATRVPIVADCKFGQTWGEMKKFKPNPEECTHEFWRWDKCVACGCTHAEAQEIDARTPVVIVAPDRPARARKPQEDPWEAWGGPAAPMLLPFNL